MEELESSHFYIEDNGSYTTSAGSTIGGVWGGHWQDLRVVGYLNGKAVAEQRIAGDGVPQWLVCRADDDSLAADGTDMTRISFFVADRYGNVLPFVSVPVTLSVDGPATLVGENPFGLVGGVGAVYLRAGRRAGKAVVEAAAAGMPEQTVSVRIGR